MIDKKSLEKLTYVATLIGLIKVTTVIRTVARTKNVKAYNITSTLLGILTSTIWLLYDLSKYGGAGIGVVTAGAALALDCYVLHLLLQERKKDKRG